MLGSEAAANVDLSLSMQPPITGRPAHPFSGSSLKFRLNALSYSVQAIMLPSAASKQ